MLKSFLKAEFRSVVAFLQDCPELARAIDLDQIPHFTTLQKSGRRLLKLGNVHELLAATQRSKSRRKLWRLLPAENVAQRFVQKKRSP